MVVAGLGLLFGGRADAGRVRADRAGHRARGGCCWAAGRPTRCSGRVADAGAEPDDDGTLLLSRTVTAEGRSRAHVGGRAVPVAVLGERRRAGRSRCTGSPISCGCCARPSSGPRWTGSPAPSTRSCSAGFGGAVRAVARGLRELADRRANARQRNQEADLLRLGLDEISRVDPQPGEDVELRAEAQRLEHVEGLRARPSWRTGRCCAASRRRPMTPRTRRAARHRAPGRCEGADRAWIRISAGSTRGSRRSRPWSATSAGSWPATSSRSTPIRRAWSRCTSGRPRCGR